MPAKNSTSMTSASATAPATAPSALPRPPLKATPPTTTEAIEVRMNGAPAFASPAVVVET
jgi:hypothetical protein